MNLPELIGTHGYWVLFLGCLLEGETLLLLAGFAAHRGYLNLGTVMAVAATAGFLGDQAYYWLGRLRGQAMLARFPSIEPQTKRVQRLAALHPNLSIVAVRFAYGLRTAGPILMGGSGISPLRFALFNALGAALWAAVVASAGWFFGQVAKAVLGEVHLVEHWIFAGGALLGLAFWAWRRWHAQDDQRAQDEQC